jgi:predicted kinase
VIGRVLLVTGTVGVGKTTIAKATCRQLAEVGDAHALVDLDQLSELWPPPEGDPFNRQVTATNLQSVATNFGRAGARSLVLAGVVANQDDVRILERAVGQRISIVRLTATAEVIQARLHVRHGDLDPTGLAWHVARAPVLSAVIDASDIPMAVVDNRGQPTATATAVLAAVGWLIETRGPTH